MSLLKMIEVYDKERTDRINQLEDENIVLQNKISELSNQLFSYAQEVDRMKMGMILTDALVYPSIPPNN